MKIHKIGFVPRPQYEKVITKEHIMHTLYNYLLSFGNKKLMKEIDAGEDHGAIRLVAHEITQIDCLVCTVDEIGGMCFLLMGIRGIPIVTITDDNEPKLWPIELQNSNKIVELTASYHHDYTIEFNEEEQEEIKLMLDIASL